MDLEKRQAVRPEAPQGREPEGCLVVAVRLPVRIVALVVLVPVRMVWDVLVVVGRVLRDTVLRPLGRALAWVGKALFVWPFVALWRWVLVPAGRAVAWLVKWLVVVPAVWLYRWVLTPVGHGIAWLARGVWAGLAWVYARLLTPAGHGVLWLVRYLVVVPAVWVYRWVLAPAGRAVAWTVYWTGRVLFVLPAQAVWRWVMVPVGRVLAVIGREARTALGHAWRVAGHISLAVGRLLGTLFRWIFVEPVRWVYHSVLTPLGHAVRDAVLRPVADASRAVGRGVRQALASVRESVRQVRYDVRRTLFGEPRERPAVAQREPRGGEARTLGRSTTALTKD
ncbi:hypothetical protein [Streptomyces sp. JB150]|uniref:hypothetical protein n=1 Tax=Streptomyces sp. JB150 TaxID=2714844 RepID=UPI00140765A5|nr:hypothetical protein [Streptomyces sp. JB150]QIJ62644.1 hypothetical protein G7Z13_11785 [Streptomyces sp. JB150]